MLVIVIIAIILIIVFLKLKIKKMIYGHLNLFTGELKVGKSAISLSKAKGKYNSVLLKWKIKKFLVTKILHKKYDIEKPYFYSNIPVGFDYVPFTLEHLEKKKRLHYGSVVWIDEASLLADNMSSFSQTGKSKDEVSRFNAIVSDFVKLFCHETYNGYIYYNTQALSDMHYAFRRVSSRYYYLHSCIKWLPFIVVYRVIILTII